MSDTSPDGDLDVLLRGLGEDDLAAPPPEVALAAVRVFRYRLIAILAVLVVVATTAPAIVRALTTPYAGTAYARLAADPEVFRVEYRDHQVDGDEHVLLWDAVCEATTTDRQAGGTTRTADGNCYLRVQVWSDAPDGSVWVEGVAITRPTDDDSAYGLGNEQANNAGHEWVVKVPAFVLFADGAAVEVQTRLTRSVTDGRVTSRTFTFPTVFAS